MPGTWYDYYWKYPIATTVVFQHVWTPNTSAWYVVVNQGDRSVTADLPPLGDITVTLPEPVPPEETPETY
ncbi:MAG: hypothetical protein KAW92_09365 [Candidatus Cloacimonetes bacterium]|nr:hypothetical protein [Candidatus Cloacimonadota bacterium]MCK4358936.1 hypothetical protein [Candidatus Cloacimonadota bacterium]